MEVCIEELQAQLMKPFVPGLYHTAEEAARAYDRRLRLFYGQDSPNTNFLNDRVAKEICVKAAKKNGTKLADLDTPEKKKQPT